MAFDGAAGRRPFYLRDEVWRLLTATVLICVVVGTLTYRAGAVAGPDPDPALTILGPTGDDATTGRLAHGMMGGKPWSATFSRWQNGPGQAPFVSTSSGPATCWKVVEYSATMSTCWVPDTPQQIQQQGGLDLGAEVSADQRGQVWARQVTDDVAYAVLLLSDGTGFVLRPVSYGGVRYLVYAYPSATPPTSLDLFAADGDRINRPAS